MVNFKSNTFVAHDFLSGYIVYLFSMHGIQSHASVTFSNLILCKEIFSQSVAPIWKPVDGLTINQKGTAFMSYLGILSFPSCWLKFAKQAQIWVSNLSFLRICSLPEGTRGESPCYKWIEPIKLGTNLWKLERFFTRFSWHIQLIKPEKTGTPFSFHI